MKQISRYAYGNTRIRAMISKLLNEDFFARAETTNLAGFIEILRKTPYENILETVGENIKPEDFELECRHNDREILKKIAKFYLSRNEKKLILLLDERYTVEELKSSLRLWRKKSKINHPVEISGNFSSLSSAKTMDDVINILAALDYSAALRKVRDDYLKLDSLFPVEIAIDTYYFEKLNTAIKDLNRLDKSIAKKIIGAEIDRENLLWLGRIQLYYKEQISGDIPGFIPGGCYISIEKLKQIFNNLESMKTIKIPQQYQPIINLIPVNLEKMDELLKGIILQQIRKSFVESPFSIAVPLGYAFLKTAETKRIVSTFTLKYLSAVIYT